MLEDCFKPWDCCKVYMLDKLWLLEIASKVKGSVEFERIYILRCQSIDESFQDINFKKFNTCKNCISWSFETFKSKVLVTY